jgi:hypothetical protein
LFSTLLAADLGADEGDVDVQLGQLDQRDRKLPDNLAGSLRRPPVSPMAVR